VRKLRGATIRATAEALGLPSTTVRDWLSRFHERAPAMGRGLTAWAIGQGEELGYPHVDVDQQAAAALGAAWWRLAAATEMATARALAVVGPDHRREGIDRQHEPALPVQRRCRDDGGRVARPAAVELPHQHAGAEALLRRRTPNSRRARHHRACQMVTTERCHFVFMQPCRQHHRRRTPRFGQVAQGGRLRGHAVPGQRHQPRRRHARYVHVTSAHLRHLGSASEGPDHLGPRHPRRRCAEPLQRREARPGLHLEELPHPKIFETSRIGVMVTRFLVPGRIRRAEGARSPYAEVWARTGQ